MTTPPSPPPSPTPHRTIAFTTPNNYAPRLATLISHHHLNWTPLWCPTVTVHPTPSTHSTLLRHISSLHHFSAVAFTSRSGISAFVAALNDLPSPPLSPHGPEFTISALGSDAEEITEEIKGRICRDPGRVRVRVPRVSTPSGIVDLLGPGVGRRVMCPVPVVLGLEEPRVVPEFLRELGLMGWKAVRVGAYETSWAGPKCAERLVWGDGVVDALVFTSTAEVEGLLKGLREIGMGWNGLRRRWPEMVVAAHGPVTALGAERLGVKVDVVSPKFGSFEGVVDVLARTWKSCGS